MATLLSDMQRTPWFSAATEPPVRAGYYEFNDALTGRITSVYWDGSQWLRKWDNRPFTLFGKDRWRGLVSPAE